MKNLQPPPVGECQQQLPPGQVWCHLTPLQQQTLNRKLERACQALLQQWNTTTESHHDHR